MATGLKQKVVIVTGAAAGIGRATALRFAREGCRVAGFDVAGAAGEPLVAELEQQGGEGFFARVDVADAPSVEAGVAAVVERWGGIDVLVNNAGILRDAQLVKWQDGRPVSTLSDEAGTRCSRSTSRACSTARVRSCRT